MQDSPGGIHIQKLKRIEQQVSTAQGAVSLLNDSAMMGLVLNYLARPAEGEAYRLWAVSQELRKAIGIAARVLESCGHTDDTQRFSRSIITAARAALPIQPDTSAAAAATLSAAEQALSGVETAVCRLNN